MTPGLLSAHQVAERLGMTAATFRDHRAALEKRGFPPPLLESQYERRRRDGRIVNVVRASWSRKQVDAWLDGAAPTGSRERQIIDIRQADFELAARAAVIASRIGERRRRTSR